MLLRFSKIEYLKVFEKRFNAEIYRERNKIERFFGRLKASFRRIATRYEKTSRNFMSMIKLASVRLWIEFYESAA